MNLPEEEVIRNVTLLKGGIIQTNHATKVCSDRKKVKLPVF